MKKRGSWARKLALLVVVVEAALGIGHWIARRLALTQRAKRLAQGEAVELRQLFSGQEGWRQFFHDTRHLLRDFFIPHHGNDHRPHGLRPRSLLWYAVAAVLVKLVASGALFLYFPTTARLARVIAREIVALANRARVESGLHALGVEPVLEAGAWRKGEDMMTRDYFAHDTPDGRKPWSFIDRGQYDYVYAGENLAVDFVSAKTIHQAFMRSPSHRANILNAHYQDIGVAVINGRLGGHETELLVEFFGTKRRSPTRAVARAAASPTPAVAVKPDLGPARSGARAGLAAEERLPPPEVPRATPPAGPEPVGESETVVRGLAVTAGEPAAPVTTEPILVLGVENNAGQIVSIILSFSNFFLIALAIFLTAALLLNIFIRIRVQHPDVIVQSIAVVSLICAMVLTRLHFLERLGQQLRIL